LSLLILDFFFSFPPFVEEFPNTKSPLFFYKIVFSFFFSTSCLDGSFLFSGDSLKTHLFCCTYPAYELDSRFPRCRPVCTSTVETLRDGTPWILTFELLFAVSPFHFLVTLSPFFSPPKTFSQGSGMITPLIDRAEEANRCPFPPFASAIWSRLFCWRCLFSNDPRGVWATDVPPATSSGLPVAIFFLLFLNPRTSRENLCQSVVFFPTTPWREGVCPRFWRSINRSLQLLFPHNSAQTLRETLGNFCLLLFLSTTSSRFSGL